MTNDEFRQTFFDGYSEQGDDCDDTWFEAFFLKAVEEGDPADMELDWESDSEGADGETEKLYSFDDGDGLSFWTLAGGEVQGPFETKNEAVDALGYDPDSFPPDSSEGEEDAEDDSEDKVLIDDDDEEDLDEDEDDEEEGDDWDAEEEDEDDEEEDEE